jgi:hypothetical protein
MKKEKPTLIKPNLAFILLDIFYRHEKLTCKIGIEHAKKDFVTLSENLSVEEINFKKDKSWNVIKNEMEKLRVSGQLKI